MPYNLMGPLLYLESVTVIHFSLMWKVIDSFIENCKAYFMYLFILKESFM